MPAHPPANPDSDDSDWRSDTSDIEEDDIKPKSTARNAPPITAPKRGSFESDEATGWDLHWTTLAEFESWKDLEAASKGIELKYARKRPQPKGSLWSTKTVYVCARGNTGGKKAVKPAISITSKKKRAVPTKKTDCKFRLTVKTYPGREDVLGCYGKGEASKHNHTINILFTRMPALVVREVVSLLLDGLEISAVLKKILGDKYQEFPDRDDDQYQPGLTDLYPRSAYITRPNIRQIQKRLQQGVIRLHNNEELSIVHWGGKLKLKKRGALLYIKTASDPSPVGFNLPKGTFFLAMQSPYMLQCHRKYGPYFAGIDATHNTTHFAGVSLVTIMVRDPWGHGMPVAWLITSNITEETIRFFLTLVRDRSPETRPSIFMSDRDQAQLNAISAVYPSSKLLLCWWHVLHAIQQHFNTNAFPELWELIQKLVRIDDEANFWSAWEKIKLLAPQSVRDYLETWWISDKVRPLWSAVYRKDRLVFERGDTNMLVEAWHHLLKFYLLEGRRNRRIDHLIYVLIHGAIPHFRQRHALQEKGFKGPNLHDAAILAISDRAASIPAAHIQTISPTQYRIQSQSKPDLVYEIDMVEFNCSCHSFPQMKYCKHIQAVQIQSPDVSQSIPFARSEDIFVYSEADSTQQGSLAEKLASNQEKHGILTIQSETASTQPSDDTVQLSQFVEKLKALVRHLNNNIDDIQISDSIQRLMDSVNEVLPPLKSAATFVKEKLPPNKGSGWKDTLSVMGMAPRGKKKRKAEYGPYAGGERPGKKAKLDALEPSQADTASARADDEHPKPQSQPLVVPTPSKLAEEQPPNAGASDVDAEGSRLVAGVDLSKFDEKLFAKQHRNIVHKVAKELKIKVGGRSLFDVADDVYTLYRKGQC